MGNPVFQYVTEKIVKMIESGNVLPWQKPWDPTVGCPMNMITRKPYHGINIMLLSFSGFRSPYWLSLKQCLALGGRVRREEFANRFMVIYWNVAKFRKLDSDLREYLPNDAKEYDGKQYILRYYYVYNVEQCEGIPEEKIPVITTKTFNPIERCEEICAGYVDGPEIIHGGSAACYMPKIDKIAMPIKEAFADPSSYYATLFHELVHSTGHSKRLARAGVVDFSAFGSDIYGKEELVAEMGSSLLCAEAGIENSTINSSASYINGWLERFNKDPRLLVSAAGQAEKAVNYILRNGSRNDEDEGAHVTDSEKVMV